MLLIACAPAPKSGFVLVYEGPAQPTGSVFELRAAFEDNPLADIPAGLVPGGGLLQAEEGCVLLDPDAYEVNRFDGGPITIAVDGRDPVSTEGSGGEYRSEFDSPSAAAGVAVQLSVEGSDSIPAVDAELNAPATLGVTLPSAVSRDSDWVITWDASVDADQVELLAGPLICQVPATAGSLTVRASLLEAIPRGDDRLQVQLSAVRSTVRSAGGVDVRFQLGESVADIIPFE